MRLSDLWRFRQLFLEYKAWIEAAEAGTALELPVLNGVKLFGRKGRLITIYDVEE